MKNIFINKTNNLTEEEQNTINAALNILSNKKATLTEDGEIVIPKKKENRIKLIHESKTQHYHIEDDVVGKYSEHSLSYTVENWYDELAVDFETVVRADVQLAKDQIITLNLNGHHFTLIDSADFDKEIAEIEKNLSSKEWFEKHCSMGCCSDEEGLAPNDFFDINEIHKNIQQMQINMNNMFKDIFRGLPF